MNADYKKGVQLYVDKLEREIAELEQTKAIMINETAKESIELYVQNLQREVRHLKR